MCTAVRWQKRAEEEFGFGLAEAIRRCILCSFDAPGLRSGAFVQAVWDAVMRPVDGFLAAWEGDGIEHLRVWLGSVEEE